MFPLTNVTAIARSAGDPRILEKGPSSLTGADRLARGLGWFSLGLGAVELLAPRRITSALGLRGREGLVRAYGAREIASGIPTLSFDKQFGLASRIAGDALDLATLASALRPSNRKRGNAALATLLVAGVTLLDIAAAAGVRARHARGASGRHDYGDRSGLPRGVQASRGLARADFQTPRALRAEGETAQSLP